ncbi:MAG: 2-vinyl bacteriochlorophyllide hydratase [Alphaproteobacteria bacterium]|nr:2-vinyl bacteriochlorophyllide hydratase [Alphaproteobacteria bacterium]
MPSAPHRPARRRSSGPALDAWIDAIAACPWPAHAGVKLTATDAPAVRVAPLYTPDERRRRDASAWTTVQAVLAPLQFLAFAVSLWLVLRFLITGHGYELAIISIIVKTSLLYTIMVTGSIWEKDVFGKWLFARPFFWEDVFSMLVLALHTAYLLALLNGWGSPQTQMYIAVCAYATYVINAAQFVMKLRAARLEAGMHNGLSTHAVGRAA